MILNGMRGKDYPGQECVIEVVMYFHYAAFVYDCYIKFLWNIDLDYCDPNPCQHGGVCEQRHEFHECVCREAYKGKLCEREYHEVATRTHSNVVP